MATLKTGYDVAILTASNTPTIIVAGDTYFVPPLAPRQNRRIIPRMSRLGNIDFANLSEEKIDDLYMIIYWALTRAYDVSEKDFMDWAIPLTEIMPALAVITEQTGMAALTKPGEKPPAGEAMAQTTSTGTELSPVAAPLPDGDGMKLKTLISAD